MFSQGVDMRRALLGVPLAVVLLTAGPALAQSSAPRGPGPGRGMQARHFDPSTVETVSGEVKAVRTFPGRPNEGVHAELQTSAGVMDVHLGPSWYLEKQGLKVQKGDSLEVTGSKVQMGGNPALIAQLVKKGGSSVTLRDPAGIPVWSRRAR